MIAAISISAILGAAVPVAEEKSWLHFPDPLDFRSQHISRAATEKDWPFTVDEGFLLCAYVLGQPTVYFVESLPDEADPEPARIVVVSTDIFEIAIGAAAGGGLLDAGGGLAAIIPRLAAFEALGARLCAQPRGTTIGPRET